MSGLLEKMKSWLFAEEEDGYEPQLQKRSRGFPLPAGTVSSPSTHARGRFSYVAPGIRKRRASVWIVCEAAGRWW